MSDPPGPASSVEERALRKNRLQWEPEFESSREFFTREFISHCA